MITQNYEKTNEKQMKNGKYVINPFDIRFIFMVGCWCSGCVQNCESHKINSHQKTQWKQKVNKKELLNAKNEHESSFKITFRVKNSSNANKYTTD